MISCSNAVHFPRLHWFFLVLFFNAFNPFNQNASAGLNQPLKLSAPQFIPCQISDYHHFFPGWTLSIPIQNSRGRTAIAWHHARPQRTSRHFGRFISIAFTVPTRSLWPFNDFNMKSHVLHQEVLMWLRVGVSQPTCAWGVLIDLKDWMLMLRTSAWHHPTPLEWKEWLYMATRQRPQHTNMSYGVKNWHLHGRCDINALCSGIAACVIENAELHAWRNQTINLACRLHALPEPLTVRCEKYLDSDGFCYWKQTRKRSLRCSSDSLRMLNEYRFVTEWWEEKRMMRGKKQNRATE